LKEQELVTKRAKEYESKLPTSPTTTTAVAASPMIGQPVVAKVGFAAVQEMARLQEQEAVEDDLTADQVSISGISVSAGKFSGAGGGGRAQIFITLWTKIMQK
jgi:hypothetical protein